MNFLFPSVLWALPLVAAPILIHLLNRQRYQKVDFGAMEFLRRAIRRTRRRVLLEDILLLALRTLAVLFLILGLAGPTLGPDSLLGSRPPQAEIYVVDYSMSMNRRVDGISALERSIQQIQDRLAQLDPARGDRAALVLAGPNASRPAFGDPAEVRLVLDELQAAPAGAAATAAALETARTTAQNLQTDSGLTARILVYSDFQAASWELDGSIGESLQRLNAAGFPLQMQETGLLGPNTAVTELEVTPGQLTRGNPVEVRGTIRRFGPATTVRATLMMDQVPVHTRSIELGHSGQTDFQHMLQPAEVGARSVSLVLDSDELSQDDQRHAILHVGDAAPVALVGEAAASNQPDGVFDSMRRYLDLGGSGPLALQTIAPQQLDATRLQSSDIVVLADPESMAPNAATDLRDFVLGGGGLLIAVGSEVSNGTLTTLLEALDGTAITVEDARDGGGATGNGEAVESTGLAILNADHAALQMFRDPRWQPLLTEVPHLRYRPLRVQPNTHHIDRVLRFRNSSEQNLDFGDALLTWRVGAGKVALLSAAPLPAWNMMDQVPGGTLPFLLDLALWLTPRLGHDDQIMVGDAMVMELPKIPTAVTLLDPIGRSTTSVAPPESLPGGRARLPLLDRALQAGIWEVQASLLEADGLERQFVERIAVNPPAAESDPTLTDLGALQAALPEGSRMQSQDAPNVDAPAPTVSQKRLDLFFFSFLAAFLLLETLLAAVLDRRRG